MKKIILGEVLKKTEIYFKDLEDEDIPVFSKKNGVIDGMLVKNKSGWLHCLGADTGACGFYISRKTCLGESLKHGYEFFIDQGGVHKKIILEKCTDVVHLTDVNTSKTPIFVSKNGKFIGMVILDTKQPHFNGWVIKTGESCEILGHFSNLSDLIERGIEDNGFKFYIE